MHIINKKGWTLFPSFVHIIYEKKCNPPFSTYNILRGILSFVHVINKKTNELSLLFYVTNEKGGHTLPFILWKNIYDNEQSNDWY